MVRIHEIKLRPDESEELLASKAERKLRLPKGSIDSVRIARFSVDSRKKPEIFKVYSLDIYTGLSDEALFSAAKKSGAKVSAAKDESYAPKLPEKLRAPAKGSEETGIPGRPVVAGFGPCGMFAGLALASCGMKPLIIERGLCMEERMAAVERFWEKGELSPLTNVQFGEGGAGTFSDGKLTTGTKDPAARYVLESFVEAGADPSILYMHHPHIGTDVLRGLVVNIRKRIISLGGEILFGTELTGLDIEDGRLRGVYVKRSGSGTDAACADDDLCEGGSKTDSSHTDDDPCAGRRAGGAAGDHIPAPALIIATGHSARDTVRALYAQGLMIERKQFSMGVRIEHPQRLIDIAQYGAPHEELGLPPAEYKLNTRCADGRGVYTFCMCPGGYVVASASEKGGVVTNGMSNSDRAGENANSALLCDVRVDDFPSEHPLSGMELQERYERLAFELGGSSYRAPAQRVGDFLKDAGDRKLSAAAAPNGPVSGASSYDPDGSGVPVYGARPGAAAPSYRPDAAEPTYRPGVSYAEIEKCLPDFVSADLREALPKLGKMLEGFDDPSALMTAVETRSSAPFRIKRDASRRCLASDGSVISGVFPGGEGAGYAGGIMSAACDGVHLAEAVMESLC